jgi:bifunctional UDP-N-acetylglucosamine pyrophosphorylase/glucosamine-1-phosphate N-acetyltransferase
VLAAARALEPAAIHVVYGHGGEEVRAPFAGQPGLIWALQAEQLGTGHAVAQALPGVDPSHLTLVLCGDVPLVRPPVLRRLLDAAPRDGLTLLTAEVPDPSGYGRIVRDARGGVTAIVEHRDATDAQRRIHEINTGIMAAPARLLAGWLSQVGSGNAQGEYYLTDIVGIAAAGGSPVTALCAGATDEVLGVNDRRQLAEAESLHRRRIANALLDEGVTLIDPARIDVRGVLRCGRDVVIDVNAVFEGEVELGDGVRIGPNTVIRNSVIGARTVIHPNCVVELAVMGQGCEVGPFARLRPGVTLDDAAKLGNFVEIKKSRIGHGSKVNHLSYIGDTTIGSMVNVGAGTITCNYDGANKHQTVIGDGAFIGSGVELVAPVEIGAGATIGAGSTITRPAPPGQLTLERARQVTVAGWKRPVKKPAGS